jgi:hypothetical protein
MIYKYKSFILALAIAVTAGLLSFGSAALAYNPILSLTGSGTSYSLSVSEAYPNTSVQLDYSVSGSSLPTTITNFGTTDNNGNFTTSFDSSTYGITEGSLMYVTVAGQRSNTVTVGTTNCSYYGCGVIEGSLSLSQTSLSLNTGQTENVSINGSGNYYIYSNSNSSIASATINGNEVSVYGNTAGSDTVSICQTNYNSACASLYVTVGGDNCSYYGCGTGVGSLTLSQSSLSLNIGQTENVSVISSYNESIYISSNSNASVANANVSGNNIEVYGLSSGSSTITVCQNSYNQCASLYVTVNGGGSGSGNVWFNPSNPNLFVGQSLAVSISSNYNSASYPYNSSGYYYVASNSNSSVVTTNISGTVINLYAQQSGTANINICLSSLNYCGILYVTVGGSGSGTLSLSQSSVSLSTGQSSTVSAYGYSGSLYISSNSNSNSVTASVSGSSINLYALSSGSSTIQVCGNNTSQCADIYVTVNGYGGGGVLSLSQSSLNLTSGQSSTVTIYGNGSYYVSSNSNSSVVSASVSGDNLYLNALSSGSSTIVVCQNSYSQCANVYVTVNGYGGNTSVYFSPSTANLNLGQSMTVSIYSTTGYYGSYNISSNSNSSVASASITGTNLYLYGGSDGTATITVCQNSYSSCGTLYVSVGNGGSYSNSLSLSETSLNLYQGQSSTVTIYGNGSYYISSNSNPSIVGANISGNVVNVYASQNGSATITICQNSYNSCDELYVNVGNSNNYSSTIVLSQYSLNLGIGQSGTVDVSGDGGYGYYVGQNSNPGVVTASFDGSVLSIYGLQNGSSTVQICQNNASSCQFLYVTVGNSPIVYNQGGNGGSSLQYPGGNVLGATTYANGELISEGSTVYIVYQGSQTPFANASAFLGLGFKFSNVLAISGSGLPDSGYIISSANNRHPYGSWVKNGQTVYFVSASGIIPIPNWSTFLSNGGQASWIVNANYYDLNLPILSPMTNSDSRLQ